MEHNMTVILITNSTGFGAEISEGWSY
jgi:hypothetical protein